MKCTPGTGEHKGWIYIETEYPAGLWYADWVCQKCGYEDDGASPTFIKKCPSCGELSQGSKYSGYYMPYELYEDAFNNMLEKNGLREK